MPAATNERVHRACHDRRHRRHNPRGLRHRRSAGPRTATNCPSSLALFADLVSDAGGGAVADIGCGPGYVTRHLRNLGVEAFGIDLSPEMVALARRDHPDVRFEVGTMTDLDLADDSVTGVLAFGRSCTCRIIPCPACSPSSIG